MTEFQIDKACVLGVMPEKGIKRLLGSAIQDSEATNGISRAELYLTVLEPEEFMNRAVIAGGRLLSKVEERNWGDKAGYVVAFASRARD